MIKGNHQQKSLAQLRSLDIQFSLMGNRLRLVSKCDGNGSGDWSREQRFEYKVGANLRQGGIIYMIGSKMTDSSTLNPKVNSLMNLFLKREASQPLPVHKPVKKVKPNEDKASDPLYHILSWRDDVKRPPIPSPSSSRVYSEPNIAEADPTRWGLNVQGIFMNIDWGCTSMETFKQFKLPNEVLSNGMVFVWGTKTNIGELLDHFDSMGYVYAENFIFVLTDRNKIPAQSNKQLPGNSSILSYFSKTPKQVQLAPKQVFPQEKADYETGKVEDPSEIFLNSHSEYFSGSQHILYMFRKINKKQSLELRHQRTSDVYFTIGDDDKLDWKAKSIVYRMIETLLISANYKEGESLKLMELWAGPEDYRKGWITVREEAGPKKDRASSQEGTII